MASLVIPVSLNRLPSLFISEHVLVQMKSLSGLSVPDVTRLPCSWCESPTHHRTTGILSLGAICERGRVEEEACILCISSLLTHSVLSHRNDKTQVQR